MKCVICDRDFEAKRADAKFCSSTCRNRGNRMEKSLDNVERLDEATKNETPVPAPEKEKKTLPNIDERGTLREGQTQEEYIENIPERGYLPDGSKCTHPTNESMWSRCLLCMELIPMMRIIRKPILKQADKKK